MGVPGGGKETFMRGMVGERKGLFPAAFVGAPGVVAAAGERNGLPSIVLAAGSEDVALEGGGGGKVTLTRGFSCEWKGLSSITVLEDAPGVVVEDSNDGEFLLVGV
jgi:hypothetical protein